MPPKRHSRQSPEEAPANPQNSPPGKRNRRLSNNSTPRITKKAKSNKSTPIKPKSDSSTSKGAATEPSTDKDLPTWNSVCQRPDTEGTTSSPSSSTPALRTYKRRKMSNVKNTGCLGRSKKANTTRQLSTVTPESSNSSGSASASTSILSNPSASTKRRSSGHTKMKKARQGNQGIPSKKRQRGNKPSKVSGADTAQASIPEGTSGDGKDFAFTLRGHKYHIGDSISVSSSGDKPFVANIVGTEYLNKHKMAVVHWYYRKSELGCRKWMGSRELCLAPKAKDSIPLESINYAVNVWNIGTNVELIADVPLNDYFYRFEYDLESKKILFPGNHRPSDIQTTWERSLRKWTNAGTPLDKAVEMFKTSRQEKRRQTAANSKCTPGGDTSINDPTISKAISNPDQFKKMPRYLTKVEMRSKADLNDGGVKQNEATQVQQQRDRKCSLQYDDGYALQEDVFIDSPDYGQIIGRIVRHYPPDPQCLLISPYRSPEECGNHRWMGSRELLFAASTTYIIPKTSIKRKANVWSLSEVDFTDIPESDFFYRFEYDDSTGRALIGETTPVNVQCVWEKQVKPCIGEYASVDNKSKMVENTASISSESPFPGDRLQRSQSGMSNTAQALSWQRLFQEYQPDPVPLREAAGPHEESTPSFSVARRSYAVSDLSPAYTEFSTGGASSEGDVYCGDEDFSFSRTLSRLSESSPCFS